MSESDQPIAYFCSEFALTDRLPIFAGGLGVLAGDLVLEAQAQKIPLVAVGLFYHHGFEKQGVEGGEGQFGAPLDPRRAGFKPLVGEKKQAIWVEMTLNNRKVRVKAWERNYGTAWVILLDTDVPENQPVDRAITGYLYDPDIADKLNQQAVLGIGGIRMLRKLKIEPRIYHLNEGHTAFAAIELALEELRSNPEVKSFSLAHQLTKYRVVATKHTKISASGSFFNREQFFQALGGLFEEAKMDGQRIFVIGEGPEHPGQFSTTRYLIKSAAKINGVSKLHVQFEATIHVASPLFAITNGVYLGRWLDKAMASCSQGGDIWRCHQESKTRLIKWVNESYKVNFSPEVLTVVWARRLAAYKRPELIFSHPEKLEELVSHADYPVQFLIAGNPNPYDLESQAVMNEVVKQVMNPKYCGKVVYLPNYNLKMAKKLVTGADLWLNTPVRGQEACGTSSMKSGGNGVLQCTTADGWIEEVDWEGVGWMVPVKTAEEDIYPILGEQVVPTYYRRDKKGVPVSWVARMKRTREIVLKHYTTERVWGEYETQLYRTE
jgi:starch phosphorylase